MRERLMMPFLGEQKRYAHYCLCTGEPMLDRRYSTGGSGCLLDIFLEYQVCCTLCKQQTDWYPGEATAISVWNLLNTNVPFSNKI